MVKRESGKGFSFKRSDFAHEIRLEMGPEPFSPTESERRISEDGGNAEKNLPSSGAILRTKLQKGE